MGNYKIGFGKEAKKETGLDGLEGKLYFCDLFLRKFPRNFKKKISEKKTHKILVFILHAYVTNAFDLVFDDQWKTAEEIDDLKQTANSNRKPIYREICAVN